MHVGGLIDPVYLESVMLGGAMGELPAQSLAMVGSTLVCMAGVVAAVWTVVWGWSRVREA